MEVRLNKFLADHGVASRRRCDELITEGKVMVDGELVTALGTKVDPDLQVVEFDGVRLKPEGEAKRYYLLNKPTGVVCTNDERELRRRAIDFITDRRRGRIYTVGRLDEDTAGLVILTNDGEFANRIMHPRYEVPKTYLVKVRGFLRDAEVQRIRDGIHLAEGRTAGARVIVKKRSDKFSSFLVTIAEGKNREIRRVFAKVGAQVVKLNRVRIGPVTDRGLRVGHWRLLTRPERAALLSAAEGR